ncbi:MAG: amidophosphoribosyltransferase [Bacteroidetes bacterium]|nr:amidophosphoribosyltransferase [Bacteroidota bacterium]
MNKSKSITTNQIDKPQSNCGIVGIYGHPQASVMAYYMLHSLQHRGQEAAGITTFFKDNNKWKYASHRKDGLVLNVFEDQKIFTEKLIGNMAIGHNRYAIIGNSTDANIQPFNMCYGNGNISLSHNGCLYNPKSLQKELESKGAIFTSTSDSELFLHLIAHSKKKTQVEQILEALTIAKGAYSLAILTEEGLVAARDPNGIRPLSLGKLVFKDENNKEQIAYVVASETCAFDMIGAKEIRSIKHNELIVIDDETLNTGEVKSYNILPKTPIAHHCIFEYIYFARPDSRVFGHNVDKARRKIGKNLAAEHPAHPTKDGKKVTVISIPDSGNTSAIGYARTNHELNEIDTVFEIGLIRSHYVGRTFIQPGQDNREFKVKSKFNTVKGVIEDRNIVIVDDSIVRGTTSKSLIKLIRNANPAKLQMRIASPPVVSPCYYGMDFPTKEELIANHFNTEEEIGKELGLDGLHYLSLNKLLESVPRDEGIDYCTACFTDSY